VFGEVSVEVLSIDGGIVRREKDGAPGEAGFDGVQRRFGLAFGAERTGTELSIGSIGGEAGVGDRFRAIGLRFGFGEAEAGAGGEGLAGVLSGFGFEIVAFLGRDADGGGLDGETGFAGHFFSFALSGAAFGTIHDFAPGGKEKGPPQG